jgi:hypothetical protein
MNIKIIAVLGALVCMPALADETTTDAVVDESGAEFVDEGATTEVPAPRAVVERMTCADINQRVEELREDVKAYPELAADLEYMISRQRTACAARARRRPVHNYENVNPVKYFEPVEEVPEEQAPEDAPATESAPAPEQVPEKTPEELAADLAQIEENRAKGLCDDGTKPNRYGCCPGEKFKEVSQMKFACCPREGDGECIEPRKK